MCDTLVVVPTYNECENIDPLIRAIRAHGYGVLVVDDASPDGTGGLADRLAADDPEVAVLHRSSKSGLGPAYAAGFAEALKADCSVICQMDADFSHDPEDLPNLVAAIHAGADLAIGSRYIPGGSTPDWPLVRRLISGGGNLSARIMLGSPVRHMTGGYRAWSRGGLAQADPTTSAASGYAFQVEMAWRVVRSNCTVVEHPIVFRDRLAGESKMGLGIVVEAMRLATLWGIRRITGRLR